MTCIDTNVLIYGVERKALPQFVDRVALASQFFDRLSARAELIMIPTVVLSEFLSKRMDQDLVYAELIGRFHVASYTPQAARIAAGLHSDREAIRQAQHLSQAPRQCIKSDVMIIATAIAAGAERIVTENHEEFRKLAQGRIEVASIEEEMGRLRSAEGEAGFDGGTGQQLDDVD